MRRDTSEPSVFSGAEPADRLQAFETACARLLGDLKQLGYGFVTPNTGVISLNRRRRAGAQRTLRDIFGWSLAFQPKDLPDALFADGAAAGLFIGSGGQWRSAVRVSTVAGHLFAHSAFPPNGADAVFLGPDSYRFARLIAEVAREGPHPTILDLGAGAGVGALTAASFHPKARVIASDINPTALAFARANARAADLDLQTWQGDGLPPEPQNFDLILANPPFISGRGGRIYRDGGGDGGLEVSLTWAKAGATRLAPGGRMVIYTGSPIRDGRDPFHAALAAEFSRTGLRLRYDEIDPDIFGGMLSREDYVGVERIAAVGAVIDRT